MRSFEVFDKVSFVSLSSVLLLINSFLAISNDVKADPRLHLIELKSYSVFVFCRKESLCF